MCPTVIKFFKVDAHISNPQRANLPVENLSLQLFSYQVVILAQINPP
jgi:hypothetical protein